VTARRRISTASGGRRLCQATGTADDRHPGVGRWTSAPAVRGRSRHQREFRRLSGIAGLSFRPCGRTHRHRSIAFRADQRGKKSAVRRRNGFLLPSIPTMRNAIFPSDRFDWHGTLPGGLQPTCIHNQMRLRMCSWTRLRSTAIGLDRIFVGSSATPEAARDACRRIATVVMVINGQDRNRS